MSVRRIVGRSSSRQTSKNNGSAAFTAATNLCAQWQEKLKAYNVTVTLVRVRTTRYGKPADQYCISNDTITVRDPAYSKLSSVLHSVLNSEVCSNPSLKGCVFDVYHYTPYVTWSWRTFFWDLFVGAAYLLVALGVVLYCAFYLPYMPFATQLQDMAQQVQDAVAMPSISSLATALWLQIHYTG